MNQYIVKNMSNNKTKTFNTFNAALNYIHSTCQTEAIEYQSDEVFENMTIPEITDLLKTRYNIYHNQQLVG